ncbi:MAG TPA: hypothetical protein VM370_02290 [Candidatus Thermoplasmatota archaeon]|nr:hypothetical protein [Candidatus Thermoplasmatota archaeon]
MDIVGAWISDETATDFNVNIALASWIPVVSEGAGFTIQFTHQGVEFGVLAGYVAQTWTYGNGAIDDGGGAGTFNETTGSFQESPPVISVLFAKSNFPHTNMADNQLVDFWGGSIDLKPIEPLFFAPAQPPVSPDVIACDEVTGTGSYTFTAGAHSMHASGSAAPTPSPSASASNGANATSNDGAVVPAAAPTTAEQAKVPAPGLALVVAACVAALALRPRA